MSEIEFATREKEVMVHKVKKYFNDELHQDIGGFDAEFLIDFFSKEMGAYFYNRGLLDAQAVMDRKLEEIKDELYEIEKPTS